MMSCFRLWLVAGAALIICSANAVEPQLKWSYKGESNLYAPPLVADVAPSPGKETIVSDSESRRLRCIDATGKQLWEFDGGWTKRLTSSAALSNAARPGKPTLAIGNPDGRLCCLDAETGTLLWQRDVGGIEWGAALWADVNSDGRDEVVAGTENSGVAALDAEGNALWTFKGREGGKAPVIRCPVAAADIDGDKRDEIFGAGAFGPFCLNGDGALRWETLTGDDFISSVIVADADADGNPELYCSSRNDNYAYCFDARDGKLRWRVVTIGGSETYPGSSAAVGDIDQDGKEEILVPDMKGYVYCITCSGEVRWVFPTDKRTHAAVSIGDVDGDRVIEVLIASGDHSLYCVDQDARLEWRYAADLRLIYAPTITDVDEDGKTDILFCGSDRTLRCLTLDGRYDPSLLPWPSRRFDVRQSGASFGKRPGEAENTVEEIVSLFTLGGFEQGKETALQEDYPQGSGLFDLRRQQPRGWLAETMSDGTWTLDADAKHSGTRSLNVVAGDQPVTVVSEPIEADPALRSVSATIAVKGEGSHRASVRWLGLQGILREDPLDDTRSGSEGWSVLALAVGTRPHGVRWLQVALTTQTGTTWWDDVVLNGVLKSARSLRALVNQVGYDVGTPKRFTAESNFVAGEASFDVIDEQGTPVFNGVLRHEGRIRGAYGNDWGYEYWRGDFSEFDTPGKYRIRITLDKSTDVSWPFEIGSDLIWEKTARPAYHFFYYQRCGMEVPGFHKACHLDDAASPDGKRQYDLWGGWHDAGDYNTYDNVPYVLGLLTAYGVQKGLFDQQDADGNGRSDFLDEILWGGEHTRRMIAPDGSAYGAITSGYGFWGPPELETDNRPGTGDERRINGNETGNDSSRHAAAMAAIAKHVSDKDAWIEAAERALNRGLANNQRGPLAFAAALDLYVATQDGKYATLAKELFPGPNIDVIESIRLYDALFHENHSAALKDQLVAKAEEMLALLQNPFGVYTFGPKEKPNFFGTPADQSGWHVGTSSRLLEAAALVAEAYQYNTDPRYLEFVYDQFNWTLGNNPYDISLMEGAGSAFPPTYHHRYAFSGVPRGAVPGSIVNGITWRVPGDDRPYFDMRGLDIADFESNEVWLPHNTAYLSALVNLRRARHPMP